MIRGAADAGVVGGGVVGCSIADHLARRGAEVVLVEKETLGSQSTGRCAGGIRRQFSSAANVVMQQLSMRLLAGLEAETGVDPEFRHIGYLFVLTSDTQVADFRRLLPMWQDRKSTRLNSSHSQISYAVFCLKKKKKQKSNTICAKNTQTLYSMS